MTVISLFTTALIVLSYRYPLHACHNYIVIHYWHGPTVISLFTIVRVLPLVVGFRWSRKTMEFCAAECSSVSASSGVADKTDVGLEFAAALSAGEGGRRSVSVGLCLPA